MPVKTVKNMGSLQREALRRGAAVEDGGQVFNAGQERAPLRAVAAAKPIPSPGTAAIPSPGISREELVRILDERDKRMADLLKSMTDTFSKALAALKPAAPVSQPGVVDFDVKYGADGAITKIKVSRN